MVWDPRQKGFNLLYTQSHTHTQIYTHILIDAHTHTFKHTYPFAHSVTYSLVTSMGNTVVFM